MSDKTVYGQLREASWERQLTPAEDAQLSAWLASHPVDQADWELERSLNTALHQLPDAPVPANFTARLMQSIELEERKTMRESSWWSFARPWSWALRGAFASVVLAAGLLAYHQVQVQQRQELARSVTAVSEVVSMPGPDILQDFEAIRVMNAAPVADEELLALFQ